MGMGGEVGQGCQVGTALFWSRWMVRWEGASSSRYRSVPRRTMATSLCVAVSTRTKAGKLRASRRSDHNLVKRTFCSLSQRDCLYVWSSLPSCPNPPTKFLSNVIAALCILKIVNLNMLGFYIAWHQKGICPSSLIPSFWVCPASWLSWSSSPVHLRHAGRFLLRICG